MNMMRERQERTQKEKQKTLAYIGESYYLRSVLQSFTDRASHIAAAALPSVVQ